MRTEAQLHEALLLAGHLTVVGVAPLTGETVGPGNVRLDFEGASAGQITAAEAFVAAFDWSDAAQATADNLAARTLAETLLDDPVAVMKAMRGGFLATLDELNAVRAWLAAFKVEVAAATSLADLKTRVAGLPNMPQRTTAQLRTVISNAIATGTADT